MSAQHPSERMVPQLSWAGVHEHLQYLEDDSYLSQDAILVFPHWPGVTAYFTFFHFDDDELVVHARFDGTPPPDHQLEEASSALCYPAMTWFEISEILDSIRLDFPKRYDNPAGVGFPPEFIEDNFISRFAIVGGELVAVAVYDPEE